MLKDYLRPKDFCRDFVHVQTRTPSCPNKFSLLWLLKICAAMLFFTIAGISQADAQTAVVTASTPTPSPGSGTVTYSASVSTTNPTLTSEQQITNVTYAWGSSDSCNPTTSSSTTVTATRTSPGSYSSSVSCTVTWYIYNTVTKNTTTVSASGSASVSYKLGVLWAKGTITGGIMTSPQNQTSSPYTPATVTAAPGGGLTCTVNSASATDTDTFTYPGGSDNGSGTDTVTYAWTATSGTFSNPSSASTTWTGPSVADIGSNPITITCKISATAPAVVSPDGGTRGPSSISATVQVYIPEVSLTLSKQQVENGKSITGQLSLAEPSSLPGGVSVTLTSSTTGGEVSFSPASVTVPGDGSSIPVTITGTTTSTALNDVTITATGGAYSTPTTLTVFALTDELCKVLSVEPDYQFIIDTGSGQSYFGPDPQGSDAVTVGAQANVTPTGADVSSFQIGIVQNITECYISFYYAAPTVVWNDNAVAGTTYTIPQQASLSWSIPAADDAQAFPYYGSLQALDPTGHIEIGDGPYAKVSSTQTKDILDANGNVVGTATYNVGQATISQNFTDWCAIVDNDDNSVTYPSSDGWTNDITRIALPEGPEESGGSGGSPIVTGTVAMTLVNAAQDAATPSWSGTLNETP